MEVYQTLMLMISFATLVVLILSFHKDGAFTVTDCVRSDQPRKKHINTTDPQTAIGICFGIIGGADYPTAIIYGSNEQSKLHEVCSALHFASVEDVEWRIVFHDKRRKDFTVEIISS